MKNVKNTIFHFVNSCWFCDILYFFAEINAHPEIDAHQKQWVFKGGSTQNRWLLVGDFSKGGGGSTQNRWVWMGFGNLFDGF